MNTNRSLETRDNEQRRPLQMAYYNPFSIPPEVYEEGMSFHWGRVITDGENDTRYDQLISEGWMIVPRKKSTNGSGVNDPLNRNSQYKDCYYHSGHILMKSDKELLDMKRKHENEITKTRIRSLEPLNREDMMDYLK